MRLRRLLLAVLLVALALSGCPTDDVADDDDCAAGDDDSGVVDDDDGATDDDDGATDDDELGDDDDVATGDERLAGMVFDSDGDPQAGVEVGGLAVTGSDGWFELLLSPGEQIIPFSGEGLAPAWQRTELPGGADHGLLQRLRASGEPVSFPVLAGVDTGVVSLGPAAVDVAGLASITVTGYAPEDLLALPVGRAPLVVHGALRIDLADAAGQSQQLVLGELAQIDLAIPDPAGELSSGQDLAAFRFDPETGGWAESGSGVLYAAADSSLVWLYHAASPGLWAAGVRPQVGCYEGRVVDSLGAPRPAAWLGADGGNTAALARGAADGTFRMDVAAGLEHTIEALWLHGDDLGYLSDVAAAGAPAGEECLALGDLEVDSDSCVSGTVLDASLNPVEGAEVRSSLGTTLITGVAGAYCMPAPVLTRVSMYGPLAPGEGGHLPWTVVTAPGSPTCAGGCPNIAVLRTYLTTTCATGTLMVDGSPVSGGAVQLFDEVAPELPVYEVISGSGGAFCSEVPGGASVTALSGDPTLTCASATGSTVGLSTGSCPSGCLDLGTLDCNSAP